MLTRNAAVLAGTLLALAGCGTSSGGLNQLPSTGGTGGSSTFHRDAGAQGGAGGSAPVDAGSAGRGGSGGSSGSGGSGGAGSGGSSGSGGTGPTTISCSSPSNAYAHNGNSCGRWRWGVKTGTDYDVGKVNLTPQVTTIEALTSLPTTTGNYCHRTPNELKTYELRDVSLKFEHLESDSDYHIIASDSAGRTMIIEVPYPGCVGQNNCQSGTPWLCEITHARAAVDAKNPGAVSYAHLGIASVVGVGFYDTYELQSQYPPTGMAPNGFELHPVLGICFGKGCNPLKE